MSAELAAIIQALDAFKECDPDDTEELARLEAIYRSKLDDVLARCPGLSRKTLVDIVSVKYRKWLKAQLKPASLPPKA